MPLRRPLLRRLRLPFRHECFAEIVSIVPQRQIERSPSALPKRCPAIGRLRPDYSVVLAGGLEPPASRLRGECSAR